MVERTSTDRDAALLKLRRTTGGEMLSEFLGTFVLIAFGCGSVAVAVASLPGSGRQEGAEFGAGNWLIIALGWGLAVVFGVYVAGGVSGAHLNPAITLAWAIRRNFPWAKVPLYWIAQVVGAFVAALLVYLVYHQAIGAFDQEAGITRPESLGTFAIFATFPAEYYQGGLWGPLIDQIVGTAFLVALVAAVIDNRNQAPGANMAPYIVGFIVVAIGLSYGTNAGYAINPARDFGPRLFTWFFGWDGIAFPGRYEWFSGYWWVPIVGPLIGGIIGVLVYDLFIGQVLSAREEPGGDVEVEQGRVPRG